MSAQVVLVMHGSIPTDFPQPELGEYFSLNGRIGRASDEERPALVARQGDLEKKLRSWPRTAENDPYWAGSMEIAEALSEATGHEVIVAFNEFCAPTVEEGIAEALSAGSKRVMVTTAMLTRGGDHAEEEIPEHIDAARAANPGADIVYAWPFPSADIAEFFAEQLKRFD